MTKKQLYVSPEADILEMRPCSVILTSALDTLMIDEALNSLDEITFTDFNQVF